MSELQRITQYLELKGARVLLRIDLNLPIKNGVVTDEYRLQSSMSTINFLRDAGAIVILIAHIESSETDSFETILPTIEKYVENSTFCKDIFSETTKNAVASAKDGDVFLFENLRKWPGEKANDNNFAQALSQYADIYVNDAFSVSHREHASIVGIPKCIPSFAGENLYAEIRQLSKTFDPERPFLFILGGAKFETKLPLLQKFTATADAVYVGGALANDIYKAKGFDVGASLVSQADVSDIASQKKVFVPQYVVVKEGKVAEKVSKHIRDVASQDCILDADTKSIDEFVEQINTAKTIVWNGPLGDYEHGFTSGTLALAQVIAESDAYSIIGGGDTLAAIKDLDIGQHINFISTGGGAMLDFLANETLPGIGCLKR